MAPSSFVSAVRRTVLREGMIKPGERVLVACSGGADSVALLDVLLGLRDELGFEVAVAHFNHGLRKRAGADASFVRKLAERLGVKFDQGKGDVGAYARRRGLNQEEAGRTLRYAFLRRAARRAGATKIATGHTLDDQAETVLLRLFRGTGRRGLGGIDPVSKDGVIRPLLEVRRADVEAHLGRKKIPFRTDESNRDTRFLRNRVRSELIPWLERRFEPRVVSMLGRLADILRREEGLLETALARKMARLVLREGAAARLDAVRLARLPAGSARRAVRAFLEALRGSLRRITFEDVEKIRTLKPGRSAPLPGGPTVTREGGWIFRSDGRPARPAARPFSRRWDGWNELFIPETGVRFIGRFLSGSKTKRPDFDDSRRSLLAADRLEFPLVVRSRREGDRYRPLGAPGRKKLKEIFRAKGVSPAERDRRAVFLSDGEIVWVEGLPVAEAFKSAPGGSRVFWVERTTA
jgi:tRNA(Ile)-lysidine synthase